MKQTYVSQYESMQIVAIPQPYLAQKLTDSQLNSKGEKCKSICVCVDNMLIKIHFQLFVMILCFLIPFPWYIQPHSHIYTYLYMCLFVCVLGRGIGELNIKIMTNQNCGNGFKSVASMSKTFLKVVFIYLLVSAGLVYSDNNFLNISIPIAVIIITYPDTFFSNIFISCLEWQKTQPVWCALHAVCLQRRNTIWW